MRENELQKFYAFSLEIIIFVGFEKHIFPSFLRSHLQMQSRKRNLEDAWALERDMERTD